MSRFIWGWIATSVVVLSATAVQAQIYYPDGPVIIRRGPYAAVPSGPVGGGYDDESPYDESIPPREVMRWPQGVETEACRAAIQLTLPRSVLISPLWAIMR